ncbi:MAG: hypothetical protein A2Z44_11300 [Betaproteobacteria bacterium RBG_19FT_COMBO_58_11]|nr:MAG: hypothetical protein A2Z44_11300 [Betaproteobacteria bacterium RBG_19FT_COMBO_58_11]
MHSDELNHLMDIAWQHHENKNYSEAKKISISVLEIDPVQPHALHLIGVLAYLNNQQDIAINLISAAIGMHKKVAQMHGNLALAKTAAGDLKGAAISCRKALALNPGYADAHRVLGIVLQKQGKLKEAIREFQRAFTLGLNTEELRTYLANAQEELDSAKTARSGLNKVLSQKVQTGF